MAKSTCSHHFRVLREAGVVAQRVDGKCRFNRLRADELEQRFPGLLDAVLRAQGPTDLKPGVTGELAPAPGLERVAEIEAHSVHAWPATVVESTADGWIMRATPGLPARGRSNHALTPARPLDRSEYDGALAACAEFASLHGIDCGVQVSPLEIHVPLLDELSGRGWDIQQSVVVMTGETQRFRLAAADRLELVCHRSRHARVARGMDALRRTVRCRRARGHRVSAHGRHGPFRPRRQPRLRHQRRTRRHRRAVLHRGLARRAPSGPGQEAGAEHARCSTKALLTYLQVFSENVAGLALYSSLGFQEEYRYCHCVVPGSGPRFGCAPAGGAAAASDGGC